VYDVYIPATEVVKVEEGPTKVTLVGGGHAWIIGDPVNGVLGTANGVDGSQILVGSANLGTGSSVNYVFNPNNLFNERFNFNTYINTGSSTGAQTAASGTYTLDNGEVLQSQTIFIDQTNNVYTVRVNVESDHNSYLTPQVRCLTRSGSAYPWETVTFGTDYTMVSNDEQLQYKLTCSGGTTVITRVQVRYS
jgi:hypothetical protein